MTVSLLQTDIQWASPSLNHQLLDELLKEAPASDLYLLPEMFSTGFATSPQGIAEATGETLEWMKQKACQYDAAMAGSVAVECADGSFRNRFYFVKPDASVVFYDKHHLFTYGGENAQYTAGNHRVIVEWRGVRFMLQVCYDLRFPTFMRNRSNYDCILLVANWPESRRTVWDTLLRARAIENQCFVAAANRVGDDNLCHYNGGTTVIDAYGNTLTAAHDNEVQIITTTLDMERLARFRAKFPVLLDAD